MRFWLLGLVIIVLIGCSESSGSRDEPLSEAVDTPTMAAIEAPQPLTENEELDESDYFENAVTFIEARMAPGAASVPGQRKRLQTVTKGLFEVSVLRAGPFTISGKASGDEQYYRLELRVENIGAETRIFEPDGMLLTDEEGNQYALQQNASKRVLTWPLRVAPEATFSTTTAGGATLNVVRGYLLFEPIPETVGKIRFTFKLGVDYFEYDIDLEAE